MRDPKRSGEDGKKALTVDVPQDYKRGRVGKRLRDE